jgi:phosphatidylglycerophosphatase A
MPRFQLLALSAFGLGYLRPAPGTWGSLPPVALGLALVLILSYVDAAPIAVRMVDALLIVLCVASTIACVIWGSQAEQAFGSKDPCQVVADEVAGQSIALLFLPWRFFTDAASWRWNLALAGSAFILFRLMDIIKPPPARNLQRLQGGLGIVIDDLLAGVYALIIVQVIARWILPEVFGW